MKRLLFLASFVGIASQCLSFRGGTLGGQGFGSEEGWTFYAPTGPFSISVDDISLQSTGSKTFFAEYKDWDAAISTSGTQASRLNTFVQTSQSRPGNLPMPSGVSLQLIETVETSTPILKLKMKYVTTSALQNTFTVNWNAVDLFGDPADDGTVTQEQVVTITQ